MTMKKIELIVKTSFNEGNFNHEIQETGVNGRTRRYYELINFEQIIILQKIINERAYNGLPDKANKVITTKISYFIPK